MRAYLMTSTSILLTAAMVGNAYYQKKQFYPSVVYIIKSNASMTVVYLQALVFFLLIGKLMRRIFFGTLRAAELEHLIEKAWYAVTETCLTFTLIRDDLNAKFVALFAVLLFLKCFHWLVEDRVDFMERSPNIVILFHIRIISLLTVLASSDLAFIYYAHTGASKDSSYQLIFGFEYAILLANILNIVIKYTLHWIDIACDSQWDEKAACLLFLELLMSVIKILLYSVFFIQMLRYYSFPLFVLRPIYLCIRTFRKALNDVIMSRRAITNMNTLYPTVTQEELSQTDNVCIICREEMNVDSGVAKKLPCNHIFHVSCLRSWFQRQQTCPTCRMDILRSPQAPAAHQAGVLPPGLVRQPRLEDFVNNNPLLQHAHHLNQNHPLLAQAAGVGHEQGGAGGVGASAGAAGSGGASGAVTQDQLVAVMAQMFVQAMLNHLQELQRIQREQQDQQQQSFQQQLEQLQQQIQQLQRNPAKPGPAEAATPAATPSADSENQQPQQEQ